MNKYDFFFLGGLALWLAETAYFGWNLHSSGVPEDMFNMISGFLIAYGAIGGIVRSLSPKISLTVNMKTGLGARLTGIEIE